MFCGFLKATNDVYKATTHNSVCWVANMKKGHFLRFNTGSKSSVYISIEYDNLVRMKKWILLFAFISCAAVAQEDDGTEPFDSGVDDWGFEEGAPPKAEIPPPSNQPPPNPVDNANRFESPGFGGGGGSSFSGKAGKVQFRPTGSKRAPAPKKNWLEVKKSLMK